MLQDVATEADVELRTDFPTDAWPSIPFPRSLQVDGDLGLRLFYALDGALAAGREVAVVLGSDSPGLPTAHIRALVASTADVTLGPTVDGGFFGIASRKTARDMFAGVRWSSAHTLSDVVTSASRCGLTVATGPSWFDVDLEEDLRRILQMPDLPAQTALWVAEHIRRKLEIAG